MKKIFLTILIVLLSFVGINSVSANMAAPMPPNYANNITFQKNNDIAVISEKIDIHVYELYADFIVTYNMKNTRDKLINTPSMFISPNFKENSVSIKANDEKIDFETKEYSINNIEDIKNNGWEYAVLKETDNDYSRYNINTITFELSFNSLEEKNIIVSYRYNLGGYPTRNDDYKSGTINYYLKPAACWKDFKQLEINLYLEEAYKEIARSNLEFKHINNNHYKYSSESLPTKDLDIKFVPSSIDRFFGFFRSPYFLINLFYLSLISIPFIVLISGLIIVIIVIHKKNKKSRENKNKN